MAALQSEEVNATFFSALARVRAIHENCRSLLRTHHQRAGLELMDMMAQHQETAYERLCRWGMRPLLADTPRCACRRPRCQARGGASVCLYMRACEGPDCRVLWGYCAMPPSACVPVVPRHDAMVP